MPRARISQRRLHKAYTACTFPSASILKRTGSISFMNESSENLEDLMKQALVGDKHAYTKALQATSRMLRPYLTRRISSPSDVEEILQEILISVHKSRHTFDGRRPYKPWVFAIAKFRLQDFLRKLYSDELRHAGELEEAENIGGEDVTDSGISYELIKGEIGKLPQKQAQILHLIHAEGHTSREVAQKMNMTESAVKVAAHRAYKVLKKKLDTV